MVENLLADKLGDKASLVTRHLDGQQAKRNTMPVPNTARATIRFGYKMLMLTLSLK